MTARKFKPSDDLHAGLSAVMARASQQVGGGKVVAYALGLSEAQISRFGNRHEADLPNLAQVAHLTQATGATAVAEFMAELACGRFVAGASQDDSAPPVTAGLSVVEEATKVIFQIVAASADGAYSAAECRAVEMAVANFNKSIALFLAAIRKSPRKR